MCPRRAGASAVQCNVMFNFPRASCTHTLEPQKQERKHKKSGWRKLLRSCRAALDVFQSVEVGRMRTALHKTYLLHVHSSEKLVLTSRDELRYVPERNASRTRAKRVRLKRLFLTTFSRQDCSSRKQSLFSDAKGSPRAPHAAARHSAAHATRPQATHLR